MRVPIRVPFEEDGANVLKNWIYIQRMNYEHQNCLGRFWGYLWHTDFMLLSLLFKQNDKQFKKTFMSFCAILTTFYHI